MQPVYFQITQINIIINSFNFFTDTANILFLQVYFPVQYVKLTQGLFVSPAVKGEPAFKLWLRYAKPSLGRVLVDAGAVAALTGRGTSLLPVGVVGVEGSFAAGDAVDVISATDRRSVGKGIAAMSAEEVRSVSGQRSEVVRERLPGGAAEVVHRDQFVLADEGR